MKKTCSCIIPFYNEEKRIGAVLRQVVQVKNISEIIAVDGGSTDRGYDFVRENFPQIKLLKIEKCLGKTETVREGVKHASGDYVLLLDADLVGLKKQELEHVITNVIGHPEIDLVILKRTNTPFSSRIVRSDLVFSGERIMRKIDLDKILSLRLTKYQLEIATNKYMTKNKKRVYWFASSNENTPKVNKTGLISGLLGELKMKINVISYDPIGYWWQILFFCRKRVPF
ncbi:glycosyl transferase [Candidatus Roizmanbacteria bacterium CG02_land_8_20_14_3_00_36_15]|uniref:Glycosyl transferase n=2 Tax=Candidatus Roizmaniibacteriota TaxID=1752723 RepID=A0A2M8KME6_9BACT|nr:MAG: glycosyl transferase [Candidatus Roizmanbacteria bacterium CG03_land_8_20_14_0_80_36_21]PIV38028.1 MAG: glycosyl transferase [Candidatus Roizmanbacteria bacterium CG02_land_8_20_14_3_00_36_15]PIY69744.1 MAG: glycosyl transferase [Candidatus Roizmanbacteria bacterium CG_4_10_14_0_8_um_filter_36_36]PJA52930.1 MAG: glycosyl transferase [Candidatus Roizmanbacteria bacterium CG_4_9_14_3_um_filter_36_11]PJC82336.1 MAG: glycosyl transferase [Candidatus Roizmanbacteria bacterium CG_4_8_14_3_um_